MSKLDELNQKYGIGASQETSYTGSNDSASSSALSALNDKYGIGGVHNYVTQYRSLFGMPNNAGTNARYYNTFGWNDFTRSGSYKVPLPSLEKWRTGDLTPEQKKVLDASMDENMYFNDYQRVLEAADQAGMPFADYVKLLDKNGVRMTSPSWGNWSAAQQEVDSALAGADRSVTSSKYGRGNIDLTSRPRVQNEDGTYSTVDSTSWEIDGKHVLMPTVIQEDGEWKHISPEEALQHYYNTGEYLGIFDTEEEASAYGQQLHLDQEKYYDAQEVLELEKAYNETDNGAEWLARGGKYTDEYWEDIKAQMEEAEAAGDWDKWDELDDIYSTRYSSEPQTSQVTPKEEAYEKWQEALNAYVDKYGEEPSEEKPTTTSGSYDVYKQYLNEETNPEGPDITIEHGQLLEKMAEAEANGDIETWRALNAQLMLADPMMSGGEEYNQFVADRDKKLQTEHFATEYASAQQWSDYIAAAQQSPDIVYAGRNKAQDDLAAYLDTLKDSGFRIGQNQDALQFMKKYPQTEGWTSEQLNTFYYMYEVDPEKSAEYAIQINDALDAKKREAEAKNIQENYDNVGGAALARVLSMGSFGEFSMNALEYLRTGTISNKPYLGASQISQAIDSKISANLNEGIGTLPENIPVIGGKGVGDFYQIGNSVFESIVAGIINGAGWIGLLESGAMFFGSAADSAYYRAIEQGATPGQAIGFAVASGTFECLFEEISLDKIKGLSKVAADSGSVWKYLRAIGISSFIEGNEEINTEIANIIAEAIILQNNSATSQKIQDLMANEGLSYDEAWKQAFKDNCNNVAYAGFVGAVAGGIHFGVFSGARAAYNATPYRDNTSLQTGIEGATYTPESATDLIDYAEKYGDADLASMIRGQMDKRVEKGKPASITRGQARQLAASITPETYRTGSEKQKGIKTTSQLVDEQARGKGGLKAQTEDISVDVDGETMTIEDMGYGNKEEVRLKDSNGNIISKTFDEVMDKLPEATQTLITWAKDVLGEGYARAVNMYDGSQSIEEYVTAMNTASAIAATGRDVVATDDPLLKTLSPKQIAVAEMVGQEQRKKELADTEKRQQEYEAAKAAADEAIQNNDVTTAKEEIANLEEGVTYVEEEHAQAVQDLENAEAGTDAYEAAKAKVKEAWAYLQEYRDLISSKKADLDKLIKQIRYTARKAGTVSFGGGNVGGTQQKAVTGPLTKNQQAVVDMVNALADVFNFDYVFYDGDAQGIQGAYVKGSGGRIYININAGKAGNKYTAASTLSHELTHALQDFAQDKYNELKNYIIDSYINKYGNQTFNKLVENEMASGATREEAVDEVIANSCSEMLMNSQAVQELAQENSSLFEDIKQRIGDIVAKIKAAFTDRDTFRKAVDLARSFEDLQKYWDDAARAMVENKTNLEISGRTLEAETETTKHQRYSEIENAALEADVLEYFSNVSEDSENYLSPDEITTMLEADPYSGDMDNAEQIIMNLSDLAKGQRGNARQKTYDLMDRLLPYLSNFERGNWTEDRWTQNKDFTEWYNSRHPSLYYPGYQPGKMIKSREVEYLGKQLLRDDLPAQDRADMQDLYDQIVNHPERTFYQRADTQHNEWAPMFYSKMENTINEWTNGKGQPLPEKMSTQQVTGWLKGKGVKDEEIKWSGVVPYLEGKKSVTKQELLDVMAQNELNIETQILNQIPAYVATDPITGKQLSFMNKDEAEETAIELAEKLGYDSDDVIVYGGRYYVEDENTGKKNYVLELESNLFDENGKRKKGGTFWGDYTLPNAKNYREILFKIPGLDYENQASKVHWKENAPGTIAHARVDDMQTANGKNMLFVEEIQSDLHNAGAKSGFTQEPEKIAQYNKLLEEYNAFADDKYKLTDRLYYDLNDLAQDNPDAFGPGFTYSVTLGSIEAWIDGVIATPANIYAEMYDTPEMHEKQHRLAYEILNQEEKQQFDTIRRLRKEIDNLSQSVNPNSAPEVPFAGSSDTYTEYVMKHLLRLAAEGNYDSIGWTTAQQQSDRWSDEYEKAYRIEYDQDIPKFMRKYTKQWGGQVAQSTLENGLDVWSVDITPAMQQDVLYKGQTQYQRAAEDVGVNIDEESESANPDGLQFSRLSWEESEYYRKRDEAAEALAKSLGVSKAKAEDYIDTINGIAKAIANDQQRLDYEASEGVSALVGNTEYGGSIDFSTICKKRRLLTGTFTAIQKAMPNTALTANEILTIRRMMDDRGYEVSCGLCYVEGSRAKMGEYAKQFLEEYAKTNPDYLPNMAEINTPEGLEQVRRQHPDTYEAYVKFMNALAQRKPKLYQMATEYKGEVLKKFLNKKDQVNKYNHNGGLRLQSFSDFEIIHLIDNMQVIMDMARVGLNGQAYTKVPEFAWAMGKTGLKINLSLIAKDVDANGKLVLDEKEGMKRADAKALRDSYSENVGTIVVVFNDKQLKAAMADDFIDFIIPFHRSQWNSQQYKLMGLPEGAKDYTPWQNESYIEAVVNKNGKKQRPDNYMPNNYWDYSLTGKQNAEKYLQMCAENNRKPKFSNLLVDNGDGSCSLQPDGSTDGYWKLLIDFKMYDNEGNGVPQHPVQPIFNEGSEDDSHTVLGMLKAYEGGHQSFPVAQDVVDDFLNQYKADHPREQYQRWAQEQESTQLEIKDDNIAQNRLKVENQELKSVIKDLNSQIKELVANAKKQGKKLENLQQQMKQTDKPEVREADARKMASQLVRQYHSNVNADEIATDIKALGDYLVQHTGEELDYATLYDMAETIADKVVGQAYGILEDVTGERQIYKELAGMIRGRKFWLPEMDRGELDVLGGYNDFRKKNFGRFKLGEGGQAIDSFYEEMQNNYSKVYFPEVNTQGEMLMALSEIFDQAADMYGNPFAKTYDLEVASLANTILSDAISENLRQMAPTMRDVYEAKIGAAKAKGREKLDNLREQKNERIEEVRREGIAKKDEAVAKEIEKRIKKIEALHAKNKARMDQLRQQKNERIADVYRQGIAMREQAVARERARKYEQVESLKKHYQAKEARAAERRGNSKTRTKIRKLINDLNARLRNPNQKHYVPVNFVQATVDLLNMINLDTGRSESISAKLGEIRNMYDSYKQNETYSVAYDETMSDMLKELAAKIGDTPLNKMTADQLDSVYNALKSLHYVINNAVKVKIMEEEYNAYDLSRSMTQETRSVPKAQSNAFTKWLTAHLRADVMFNRLGGFTKNSTWNLMAEMLNDGQLKQTLIQMRLSARFAELINDSKAMQHFTGTTFAGKVNEKDLVDIGLTDEQGKPIKISHDMMVGLYMDLLNEQNRRHFMYGGKTIPDLQKFYSGKGGFDIGARRAVGISGALSEKRKELGEAIRMGETDRANQIRAEIELTEARGSQYVLGIQRAIEKNLTAFDKKWIQATQALMNEDSKRYLNETTMDVYGIEKANVPNYFPIITDRNFLNTPFESITKDMNLENVGFMKERVTASNPTYAMGTFTVVNNQINKVAQYCGLMPAIRSFNKVYNKSGAGYSDSLKQALTEKFGKEGTKYVEDLIADLTGSRKEEQNTLTQILGKLRGNLAQTSLTLNPRVALSQAASFPTAAAELGWMPLMKALAKGGKNGRMISRADTELIAKYSPLLWYRMQGYADVELGDIKNSNNLSSKVWKKMRWFTGWIQAVDGATVGRLWNAAEYWVQDNVKGVKVGTEEYYEEVAKKFNAVVEKTQPNYTTMQRAAILRDPNSLMRTFTMFMTQRLQNFNILYNSTAAYQRARADYANNRNNVNLRDVQTARNDMIRAVSSQLAQTATYVGFKFLADALLHALDAYRDKDDDELTKESISLQLINNYIDSMVGMFIAGSEIYSILKSAIGGEKWYGLSVNGVDTLNDIITDTISAINTWKDYDPEDEKSVAKLEKSMLTFGKSLSQVLGLPLNNAIKIGNMFARHAEDIANHEFLSFNAGVELDKDAVGSRMVKALEAGDKEKFDSYSDTFDSTSQMYSAIEKQIREGYLAKKQTITKEEAIDLLVDAGEPKRTAQKKVQQWTCELVTGIPYDKIDDQFIAGKISEDRAAELYSTYGGMTKADAKSQVQQIKCEKVTGIKYSNIKSEYIAGNLTDAQVKSMLKTYGGKSEDSASKTVLKYAFEKETEYSWDDKAEALYSKAISDSKLAGYLQKISPTTYGTKEKADNYVRYLHFQHDYPRYADLSESNVKAIYEAKDASGLTMQQSIDYQIGISKCKGTDKDGDGKTDTNSLRDAKIKYILSLPYSYETQLKLFKLSYSSDSALKAFKKAAGK